MRPALKPLGVVLLSSVWLTSSSAQQGPQGTPATQQPTFRVNVDLVSSDVIVRNRSGQFVADLTKEDFDVYEDGIRQELASFVLIHGGRSFVTAMAPPAPREEGIILPPPRPTNDAAGRILVFIVDDLHLDFRESGRLRDLFRRIAKQLVHEGDLFGVVSTGTSSIAIDLTYDRGRLEEVANKITGGGLRPSEIIEAGSGPNGPQEVRYRAHVGFSVAYDLMRNLRQVQNRRKAVVLISNGYDFDPFSGDPRPGAVPNPTINVPSYDTQPFGIDDRTRSGAQFAEAELAMELHELTREANRANATIYAIDPRGLIAGQDLDEQVDVREWERHIQKTQNSLRVLAEQTGGIAVVNTNDFDKALRRIDAETSDYYVLGYYSTNPDPTVRRRIIDIKVKPTGPERQGLEVQFRREYVLRPTAPPAAPPR